MGNHFDGVAERSVVPRLLKGKTLTFPTSRGDCNGLVEKSAPGTVQATQLFLLLLRTILDEFDGVLELSGVPRVLYRQPNCFSYFYL